MQNVSQTKIETLQKRHFFSTTIQLEDIFGKMSRLKSIRLERKYVKLYKTHSILLSLVFAFAGSL